MTQHQMTICLLGSLDTKGEEFAYIKGLIETRGHRVLAVDTSIVGEPGFPPDISASDVLASAGEDLESLRAAGDRGKAVNAMAVGAVRVVKRLHDEHRFDGILSMGGAAGTTVGTAAMRNLPVGLPKVMVSTLASGDVSDFVGTKDVTLIHPVVDLAGLNRITRQILARAAGAIIGMVDIQTTAEQDSIPCVPLTEMSLTADGCEQVRTLLEGQGLEVITFHASGIGGDAMEELIRDRVFDVVVDYTTSELVDVMCGGGFPSCGDRLTAAGRVGIPQVVGPGGLDTIRFGPRNRLPDRFFNRNIFIHSENVTLVRVNEDEARIVAGAMVRRLNEARGPVRMIWPLRGISALDDEDMPFYDPDIDQVLLDVLRERLSGSDKQLIEIDAHINDYDYVAAVCSAATEFVGNV